MRITAKFCKIIKKSLAVLTLTVLAVLLFVVGILISVVNILTPDRLTPIVERVANESLVNCRVEVDTVQLSLYGSFPYLHVDVSNLRILSTLRQTLPQSQANLLPPEADTIAKFDHFGGGINLAAIATKKLQFNDVSIDGPKANFVVLNNEIANFNIFPESTDTVPSEPFVWEDLPKISIHKFAITNPEAIKYIDVHTGTSVTANLKSVSLEQNDTPVYTLHFNGNVFSPQMMEYFTLHNIRFGLNGDINWTPDKPWVIGAENMDFNLAAIKGRFSTNVDIKDGLTVNSLDVTINPINVTEVLSILPDSLKTEYGIPLDISTTASVGISARLSKPFVVGNTALPQGIVSLVIPDSEFVWGRTHVNNLSANILVSIPSDDPRGILVTLNSLTMNGLGINLSLNGSITSLTDDPLFKGKIIGKCDLTRLPPIVSKYIPGTLRGTMDADAYITGRPSMLTPENFHRLNVHGKIGFNNIYWLSSDTVNMVTSNHAQFDFGTNTHAINDKGENVDSLLTFSLKVDSATILHSTILMRIKNVDIGLGSRNQHRRSKNKKEIIPMGGRLKIGQFNMLVLTDSVILRLRNVDGSASIKAHNGNMRTPELSFDLGIKNISTGDRTTRLLVSNAHTRINAYLMPQSRQAKRIMQIEDSLHRAHPDISPDSLYELAIIRHNEHRSRYPRVRPQYQPDSTEIIYWNTSNGFKRLLTQWRFSGELTSKRAMLFTPIFPIRNRVENLNVSFNNDTVLMNSIKYKAGHSDFTISGRVTNMRRAFTSHNYSSPLHVNLQIESDTIDINQFTKTAFAGSAFVHASDSIKNEYAKNNSDDSDNIDEMEHRIDSKIQYAPDTMSALLIPKNIEAELSLNARNVLYSDIILHNLGGKLLTYRGALNLHNLSAVSDVGSLSMSALYDGRSVNDLSFTFGMQVNDFNISRFLTLFPAIDSIMPVLRDLSGIISSEIAATSRITPNMDLDLPSLDAAIKLQGDSLVLIDPDTFKSLSKWLLFRDRNRNVIDHMSVQLLVKDNNMQLFPFIFDIDRYKLGVQGHNDFALNFDYHIAVLKSPIPFKFGINIKGNPDKYKIRLGRARFNEKTPIKVDIVDTTRINLVKNIENVFRRGLDNARFHGLEIEGVSRAASIDLALDTLTHEDSLQFIREGLIPAPDTVATPSNVKAKKNKSNNKKQSAMVPAIYINAVIGTSYALLRRRRKEKQA